MKIYAFDNKILALNNRWLKEPDPPPSVVIGTQTWMTESLSINDGGDGIAVLNGVTYYTQAAAIRVANSIAGWHLPTYSEFYTLIEYAGAWAAGANLASTTDWYDEQGLDTYGFNAKPYGRYYNGSAVQYGKWAPFWASSNFIYQDLDHTGDLLDIGYAGPEDHSFIAHMTSDFKTNYYQARLIKD